MFEENRARLQMYKSRHYTFNTVTSNLQKPPSHHISKKVIIITITKKSNTFPLVILNIFFIILRSAHEGGKGEGRQVLLCR